MNTGNHEFRRANHRENEMDESHEEFLSTLRVGNCLKLSERRPAAKRTNSVASEHDHSRVRVVARLDYRSGKIREEISGQRVALGMKERDRRHVVCDIGAHITFSDVQPGRHSSSGNGSMEYGRKLHREVPCWQADCLTFQGVSRYV
jgi:hypothetical protein